MEEHDLIFILAAIASVQIIASYLLLKRYKTNRRWWMLPWYRIQVMDDTYGGYTLWVKLFRDDDTIIDDFQFRTDYNFQEQRQWVKIAHTFQNYGPGLRRITFEHSGHYNTSAHRLFYNTYNYPKMAGACVCVRVP